MPICCCAPQALLPSTADPEPDVSLHLAPQDGRTPVGGSGSLDQALDVSDHGAAQPGGAGGSKSGQEEYKSTQ
jgi:hypothetical protein